MSGRPSDLQAALREITKAWEAHDDDGVVRLTMAQTSLIAAALEAALAADRLAALAPVGAGGGEVASGLVSGYLPRQCAVEVILDGEIPAWVSKVKARVYLSAKPTLDAIGRSGQGHNADWCAGWNAHSLATSQDPQP